MSNEVASVGNNALTTKMSQEQLLARLAKARDTMGGDFKQYLSFNGKTGRYSYKVDNEAVNVPHGTKMAVNVLNAQRGWSCWKDGKSIDDVAVSVFDDLPSKSSLTDHGPYTPPGPNQQAEGWVEYFMIPLKNLDTGKEFIFKTSSKSGIISAAQLIEDIRQQALQGKSLYADVPVVSLDTKTFTTTDRDTGVKRDNEKPLLKIVDWKLNAMTPVVADGGASAEQASAQLQASEPKSSFIPKSRK